MNSLLKSPTSPRSPTQRLARRTLLSHSPVLRDMLRTKCRIRMKQARAHVFNRHRDLTENDEMFMTSILRDQISELDMDIESHEAAVQELMQEADQWLFEETEKADEALISDYQSGSLTVFCPICQKNLLQQENSVISCLCGLRLVFEKGLERFHEIIQIKVTYHETFCSNRLQFFTEPKPEADFSSLSAICPACEYVTMIVL
ncbi:RIP-like protein [Phlebotomus argentipes]|uniref:RIP-like protein n=1 Tax=Phlebotomus argentipes TaxID=94469 RepID=UPI0028934958|nr:RIP-like protein [Phlebotomus argentipes]